MTRKLKTHCPAGHEYTIENTDIVKRSGDRVGGFYRSCKKCKALNRIRNRNRLLVCPFCKKTTHPRNSPVIKGIPRAVLKDGTCDLCWRSQLRGTVRRRSTDREDDKTLLAREALDDYFKDRRRRGISPDGNQDLDAAFEADTGWQKRERQQAREARAGQRRGRREMEAKEFARYLERDGGVCLHCGTDQGLVPQHRKNRGMGGSALANVASNIIVLCSALNGLVEANADWAERAKTYGWKVGAGEDPATTPVFDSPANRWYILMDDFTREEVNAPWTWEKRA